MLRMTLSFLACLAVTPVVTQAEPRTVEELKGLFTYDKAVPLEVDDSVVWKDGTVEVHDVSYAGGGGTGVTAFIVRPIREGRFPVIVWGHWGQGDRREFLSEAILHARAGTASLLIDFPSARPPYWQKRMFFMDDPATGLQVYKETVIDLLRAYDLLEIEPYVDTSRMAYVGHSLGAHFAAILSAIDDRVKAVVLAGGPPHNCTPFLESESPDLIRTREAYTTEQWDRYCQVHSALDAVEYVRLAAPTPVMLQFAVFEKYFGKTSAQELIDACSEPKAVRWYECSHEFNDPRAMVDRSRFLEEHIGTGSIVPLIEERVAKP